MPPHEREGRATALAMETSPGYPPLDAVLVAERPRLVRLCAAITGDATVAEDLAHETVMEAYRHIDGLRNPAAMPAWLAGIARNVCRRWLRCSARERARHTIGPTGDADDLVDVAGLNPEGDDPLAELERNELATLLDRALSRLPPPARDLLVQRYVEDLPQAELAARLHLSEGAVAMRVLRGRHALHRVLTTALRDDAAAFDLLDPATDVLQPTRLWCSLCGRQHLHGRFDPVSGDLVLRCPDCYDRFGLHQSLMCGKPALVGDLQRLKPALNRVIVAGHDYHRHAVAGEPVPCDRCGMPLHLVPTLPTEALPRRRDASGLHGRCPECGNLSYLSLSGIVQALPAARAFLRRHPRVRTLPERVVASDGRPALVTRIESVTNSAWFEAVTDTATLAVLRVRDNDGGRDATIVA